MGEIKHSEMCLVDNSFQFTLSGIFYSHYCHPGQHEEVSKERLLSLWMWLYIAYSFLSNAEVKDEWIIHLMAWVDTFLSLPLCSSINGYKRFGTTCCLHLQSGRISSKEIQTLIALTTRHKSSFRMLNSNLTRHQKGILLQ